MKNDFDFIRDQINNSGVKAPDDMDKDFALNAIKEVHPQPVVLQPKRKRKVIAIASVAAAVVLVSVLSVALYAHFSPGSIRELTLPGGLSLRQFGNHEEVRNAVKELRAQNEKTELWEYIDGAASWLTGSYGAVEDSYNFSAGGSMSNISSANGAATSSTSGGSSGASHSETYKQVAGVDEPDIIKTDGRYIYCVNTRHAQTIKIFSADGERPSPVVELDITQNRAATPDEAESSLYNRRNLNLRDIYICGERLVALCSAYDDSEYTVALVYDVSDIDNIVLLDSFTQSGYYDSSRMIGDTLYTVSTFYPYSDEYIPVCGIGATPDEIEADCIYALSEPTGESFLVVSAYDTLNFGKQADSKAIFGGVDDIYCNENNMYIYTTVWNYGDIDWLQGFSTSHVNSQIVKVNLTDGISFTAYTEVEGMIDDQYALDEFEGNLRVATTINKDGMDTNHLFVYDENLSLIGSVEGFAENESIRAVRYVGETAYVITYEQTDPLFVIDLSDPTAPTILGEVEITGFSTMLVPIDENTLLGIGYHTEDADYTTLEVQNGVKLALFDVSDKTNPQVLDSRVYPECDSPVQYDPRTLVYNPERNDFVIPLNYYHYDFDFENYDDDGYYYGQEEMYGGMLNFKVVDGELVEILRYQSDEAEAVERCVYVGDTVYMSYYENDYELELDSVDYQ